MLVASPVQGQKKVGVMTERETKVRLWRRGLGVSLAAGVTALFIHGCATTPATPATTPAPPSAEAEKGQPPHPTDCADEAQVELILVDLVPAAAAAYGRIDPFLYQVAPDGSVSITGEPKDKAGAEEALDLLELVNQLPLARKTFAKNIEQSQALCSQEHCPTGGYDIRRVDRQISPGDNPRELTTYAIGNGSAPSALEIRAFLLLTQTDGTSCIRSTEIRFQGDKLEVVRAQAKCDFPDSHGYEPHEFTDKDPCCVRHVTEGTWHDDTKRKRHRCY
jgi:hypothetical protein